MEGYFLKPVIRRESGSTSLGNSVQHVFRPTDNSWVAYRWRAFSALTKALPGFQIGNKQSMRSPLNPRVLARRFIYPVRSPARTGILVCSAVRSNSFQEASNEIPFP
jgi:hypothetical protein